MTRSRSTYDYASQTVRSPSGTLSLISDGRRVMLRDPHERWVIERQVSPKQLFVDDDGRAAILGADDVLTFHDPKGAELASVSLLEQIDASLVSFSTAGRSWDDYCAGTFGDDLFVLEGRGAAPLVFTPEGERCDSDADAVLRRRARSVLAEAFEALRTRNEGWQEPWVFAAIGWARVVSGFRIDAADALRDLASLPLRIHAYTSAGLRAKRFADDPILLDRWALDPLRQAVHHAQLRLEIASHLTTLKIGRKGKMLSTDWLETERPSDWTDALEQIELGTTPSSVIADHGLPTNVESSGTLTWSYAWLRRSEAVTTDITWGEQGVERIETIPLPEPTPRGLVA